jgi:hypothetical protein
MLGLARTRMTPERERADRLSIVLRDRRAAIVRRDPMRSKQEATL